MHVVAVGRDGGSILQHLNYAGHYAGSRAVYMASASHPGFAIVLSQFIRTAAKLLKWITIPVDQNLYQYTFLLRTPHSWCIKWLRTMLVVDWLLVSNI